MSELIQSISAEAFVILVTLPQQACFNEWDMSALLAIGCIIEFVPTYAHSLHLFLSVNSLEKSWHATIRIYIVVILVVNLTRKKIITKETLLTRRVRTPMTASATVYQLVCIHFLNVAILSSDNRSLRNVAKGPEGSTSRHFWKTSQ